MKCKFNTNTAELNMKNPQNDKFRKLSIMGLYSVYIYQSSLHKHVIFHKLHI